MIESEFQDTEGAKAIRSSHGHFSFVIQALDDTAGELLLSLEVIEDQSPVLTQGAGDLLQGFDTGTHGLSTPLVEELARPGRGVVLPELLKEFLEKISANGFEVEAKDVAQAEFLLVGEVLFALEQEPAGLLQDRIITLLSHAARLLGADVVEGLIHFRDNVEAIEDMQGLRALLANDLQIRLPHVRADKLDLGSQLCSDERKESLEGFQSAFLADPKQPGETLFNLIDQREIFMTFSVLDFIDADGLDGG